MKVFIGWCGIMVFLLVASGSAAGWPAQADRYVRSLKSALSRKEMKIEKVTRPRYSLNRLDVTFQPGTPSALRKQALQQIAREFSRSLFKSLNVTSVTVNELNGEGTIVDYVVIRIQSSSFLGAGGIPRE